MNGRKLTRLLLLVCVAFALATVQPLEAQFGGFGRRITEGVKKVAGGDTEEARPGAGKPVVLPTNDPYVIPITDKVLEGFANSLKTEIALKEQLFQELEAREAAEEKHAACKQKAASSPEAVQIMMQLANVGDNPSTEQMTKTMQKMEADQAALVLKMCGTVPARLNTSDRLSDIQKKAAAASGPIQ